MRLVEQHTIDKNDARFCAIDKAAFASKNLYNATNYVVRQIFFETGRTISYLKLYHQMKVTDDYKALPGKVAQWVLRTVEKNWKSYFEAKKEWRRAPDKFNGEPRIPSYKQKRKGRNLLIYTSQAISKPKLSIGLIKPSMLDIEIKTKQKKIDQVRIVPKKTHYVVEVIYTKDKEKVDVNPALIAGVDIGLNNLAAVTSNKPGFIPFLVNGRPLKSINQFYNKCKAHLQSNLEQDRRTSLAIDRLTDKRNRKIKHELHVASRRIIDRLVEEHIGHLVIGKNKGWKQKIQIGKKNNQNFVSIPHAHFVAMLKYKAELQGIKVSLTEESYTSKASFLDNDPLPKYDMEKGDKSYNFSGKRISRGQYRSADGTVINADLNGSGNIIRKVVPNAFADGIEGVVVRPLKFSFKK